MKLKTALFFLAMVAQRHRLALSTPRPRVVTSGPTMGPNFSRMTGKPMEKCPDSHPYPFDGGKHCCKSPIKVNDTSASLALDCDGGRLRIGSSLECCLDGMYLACSDQVVGCNNGKNTCSPTAKILSSSTTYALAESTYGPQNFLSFTKCEVHGDSTYNLWPDLATDAYAVIDFGCETTISKIYLRQTLNGHIRDRGTKDFTVELSRDLQGWTLLLEDTLPASSSADLCDIPIHSYSMAVGFGRYLRFMAKTYHGLSAGLNYMTWKFEI